MFFYYDIGMKGKSLWYVLIMAFMLNSIAVYGEIPQLVRQDYLSMRFQGVVDYFKEKEYSQLDKEQKLLYIECLAKVSRVNEALEKLEPILSGNDVPDQLTCMTAGIVYMSLGKFEKAEEYLMKSVLNGVVEPRASLAMAILKLEYRKFNEAVKHYESCLDKTFSIEWLESDMVFIVGVEVYKAAREYGKLAELYRVRSSMKKKYPASYRDELKANYKLYSVERKDRRNYFSTLSGSGPVVIPFVPGVKGIRARMILLTIKGKTFKVALDTGNTAGWLVHSRELNDLLNPVKGGRTVTGIGPDSESMDGYNHYYPVLDFNIFKVHHVFGIYVPKPHPDFPDANLNPSYIRDRIVSFDFVRNALVLETEAQFQEDKDRNRPGERKMSRVSWFGYKYIYVPMEIKGKAGFAMIETGAEDIALKLDFITELGFSLVSKTRYLMNGSMKGYYVTPAELKIGDLSFSRDAVEVWHFDTFYDLLTGFSSGAVVGPLAFRGKYIVSFDPFLNQVVLN